MTNQEKDLIQSLYASGDRSFYLLKDNVLLKEVRELILFKKIVFLEADYKQLNEWDLETKSRLIESFLINIPVPSITTWHGGYGQIDTIIDGEQQIKAVAGFFNNDFSLWELECWSELNGLYYSDLPRNMQEALGRKKSQSKASLTTKEREVFLPNRSAKQPINN